jgi:UDP-N-acetylmuramate dehydrogenase
MISIENLREVVRGKVFIGQPLAEYTSLKIGGPADFLVKPVDREDVFAAVKFFHDLKLPYVVLGRGSNVLISDNGVRGVVILICECLQKTEINGETVYAEAGVDLPELSQKMLKQGLGGLQQLAGVPGSVGGALVMNAGAYGREIFEMVEWVEVIRDGMIRRLKKSEIKYQYRQTDLAGDVILAAQFRLKRLSEEDMLAALAQRKELMEKRRQSQPLKLPNAGSIFRNPPPDEHGVLRYAGQLIEACGLKGYRHGGAMFSDKHANFIVNMGAATASDVLTLIDLAKTRVKKVFGVDFQLELKLVGFERVESQ